MSVHREQHVELGSCIHGEVLVGSSDVGGAQVVLETHGPGLTTLDSAVTTKLQVSLDVVMAVILSHQPLVFVDLTVGVVLVL